MIEIAAAHATSSGSPREFFARWIDHETWTKWSPDSEWVTLDGEVAEGIRGKLKPTGGPTTSFTISRLIPDRAYDDTTTLPGARLVFAHDTAPTPTGTTLDVRVTLSGPLAWLWARILRKGFATSVPADLDRLIALVEKETVDKS